MLGLEGEIYSSKPPTGVVLPRCPSNDVIDGRVEFNDNPDIKYQTTISPVSNGRTFIAMTVLNVDDVSKLFVLSAERGKYYLHFDDNEDIELHVPQTTTTGMPTFTDIVASRYDDSQTRQSRNVIFICDNRNKRIWRFIINSRTFDKMPVQLNDSPPLSLSENFLRLLVTTESKLVVYFVKSDKRLQIIDLALAEQRACHAVEICLNCFIVALRAMSDHNQRGQVCQFNEKGERHRFLDFNSIDRLNLKYPCYLTLYDDDNILIMNSSQWVIMLDKQLICQQDFDINGDNSNDKPFRICFQRQSSTNLLYIAYSSGVVKVFRVK